MTLNRQMNLDFSGIPILDHHAHPLLRRPPAGLSDWLPFFTESGDPDIISNHVPHTLFFQFAVKALAGLLGCEPKPEAVLAERDKLDQQRWAGRLIQDANITSMLVDYGFKSKESYSGWGQRWGVPGWNECSAFRWTTGC